MSLSYSLKYPERCAQWKCTDILPKTCKQTEDWCENLTFGITALMFILMCVSTITVSAVSYPTFINQSALTLYYFRFLIYSCMLLQKITYNNNILVWHFVVTYLIIESLRRLGVYFCRSILKCCCIRFQNQFNRDIWCKRLLNIMHFMLHWSLLYKIG